MKVTDDVKAFIAEKFEETFFDDVGLEMFFKNDNLSDYERFVNETLVNEGFPDHADYDNMGDDLNVTLHSKETEETWAESFVDAYDDEIHEFESMADLESKFDDLDIFRQFICNDLDKVEFEVYINLTPDELLDKFPDFEYFEQKFNEHFDVHEFVEFLEENREIPEVQDAFNDAVEDEFGSINEAPEDIDFTIVNFELDRNIIEDLYDFYTGDSVEYYMSNHPVYNDIISHYNFTVEVELDYEE